MFRFLYISSVAIFLIAPYICNPYIWVAALVLFLITRLWHSDHQELTRIQSSLEQQNSLTTLQEATEFINNTTRTNQNSILPGATEFINNTTRTNQNSILPGATEFINNTTRSNRIH